MKIALFLCTFFSFLFAFDIQDLKLLQKNYISGKFTQIKQISGFKNELKSNGFFELKDRTLFWNMQEPLKSSIKIDSNGIFELVDSKWVKNSRDYDKGLFLDIIDLNFANLAKNFDMNLSGDSKKWELLLTPKGQMLKKIFKNITIKGSNFVEEIILIENNGDSTKDIFYDIRF